MEKQQLVKFYSAYKLYIFPSLMVFSCLILIILIIYPQTVRLITNLQVEKETTTKHKLLEAKAQTLASLDAADLEEKVSLSLSSLPTERDFVSVFGLLQNITSQSGFNTLSMFLGSSPQESTKTQSYIIKLDLTGTPTLLPLLISNIENSPRMMRVNKIDTTYDKSSQGAAIVLHIEVLYSSAPAAFGSIDSPLPSLSAQDQEVIAKIAKAGLVTQPEITPQLGPRGKANPFE